MKLNEIRLTEQQLEEIRLRDAIAAGTIAAAALMPVNKTEPVKPASCVTQVQKQTTEQVAAQIAKRYKIDVKQATKIVRLAKKYEHKTFPKAEDILSIIGIESSFDHTAKSGLKKDPARGLTQIRPRVWKIKPAELTGDIEKQIKLGAEILADYHDKLKSVDDAVHAYNVGITNFRKGKHNLAYVEKFKRERKYYT